MKTICPHCNQKYDIPEEYFQRELCCEKCGQNFIGEKAKFCPECGVVNHAKSSKCRACGYLISRPSQVEISHPVENRVLEPTLLKLKQPQLRSTAEIKTVCPHCCQEYNVANDLLQQEVFCEACQKNFIVEKAKTCAKCGASNPLQAFSCGNCQNAFSAAPRNSLNPNMESRKTEREKPGCFLYTIIAIFGAVELLRVVVLPLVIIAFGYLNFIFDISVDNEDFMKGLICIAIPFIFANTIFCYQRYSMAAILLSTKKRASWTLLKKFAIWIGLAECCLGLIASIISTEIVSMRGFVLLLIWLPMTFTVFSLYKTRVLEDSEYE